MKPIPPRLECSYCIRNQTHGGECHSEKSAYDSNGCLVFKPDPRGCIRESNVSIEVPLYFHFPPLNTWVDYWQMNGVDTEVCVNWIKGIEWDTKRGSLIVHCRCSYYINEFSDDYIEPKKTPNLRIVK